MTTSPAVQYGDTEPPSPWAGYRVAASLPEPAPCAQCGRWSFEVVCCLCDGRKPGDSRIVAEASGRMMRREP